MSMVRDRYKLPQFSSTQCLCCCHSTQTGCSVVSGRLLRLIHLPLDSRQEVTGSHETCRNQLSEQPTKRELEVSDQHEKRRHDKCLYRLFHYQPSRQNIDRLRPRVSLVNRQLFKLLEKLLQSVPCVSKIVVWCLVDREEKRCRRNHPPPRTQNTIQVIDGHSGTMEVLQHLTYHYGVKLLITKIKRTNISKKIGASSLINIKRDNRKTFLRADGVESLVYLTSRPHRKYGRPALNTKVLRF